MSRPRCSGCPPSTPNADLKPGDECCDCGARFISGRDEGPPFGWVALWQAGPSLAPESPQKPRAPGRLHGPRKPGPGSTSKPR